MGNLVKINNSDVEIKIYKGERVLTFKDIDTAHNRPSGTAKRNFNANIKHFIEGVDFVKISAYEIRTNKIMAVSSMARSNVTFITESGYLMLAKSLTDDLSWKVQRELVNGYFRAKTPATAKCEQLTLETEEYFYFDKTYKGAPVLTTADLAHFIDVGASTICWYMRKKEFVAGKDYFQLSGKALAEYKRENPNVSRLSSNVEIVTKSGFIKLSEYLSDKVDMPKCFIEEKKTQPLTTDKPKEEYTPHSEMISLVGYIDRNNVLINEYCRRLLSPSTMAEAQISRKELLSAIRELKQFAFDAETIKLG